MNHSLAEIIKGLETFIEKEKLAIKEHPANDEVDSGYILGLQEARNEIERLADAAQREIDECRAASR